MAQRNNSSKNWRNFEQRRDDALGHSQHRFNPPPASSNIPYSRQSSQLSNQQPHRGGHHNYGYVEEPPLPTPVPPPPKYYNDNFGPNASRNDSVSYERQVSNPSQNYGPSVAGANYGRNVGPPLRQQPQYNPYLQQQQVAPLPYAYEPDQKNRSLAFVHHQGGPPPGIATVVEDDNPIEKNRKCRDVLCLGFFIAAVGFSIAIAGYALIKGDLERIPNTGTIYGCEDLQPIEPTNSTSVVAAGTVVAGVGVQTLTFRFPDQSSQDDISVSKLKIQPRDVIDDATNFYNELAHDFENAWKELIWMCLIALGLAIIMTILLRLFAGIIIWVVVIGISIASVAGTIVLWVIWFARKKDYDNYEEDSWSKSSINGLLVGAIVATILTILILLVFLFMRKRIALVIRLFKEAGKAIHAMPLVLLQPLATFAGLGIAVGIWFFVTILLETAGDPQLRSDGGFNYCYFKKNWFIYASRWWNIFFMYWMSQFIIGCQHVIIAGAVSTWFFTRNKKCVSFPILTSFKRLFRFHLGTIAFGSFVIAVVKMIRYMLNFISKRLKSINPICDAILCCCKCCVWCMDNFLSFLNRNAYIEVAIHGYAFCKSARKAFQLIVNNALRLAAINSIGDFVLFLGKLAIVAATVAIGHQILQKNDLFHIWAPLAVAAICAYFIADCFISVYEMAIDTIFICFCEDCELNDGISKPYFMSKGLMEFVKQSEKVLKIEEEGRKKK